MNLGTYVPYAQFGSSAIAGIGGAITSIFGAVNTAKAARNAIKSGEIQAEVARYNARLAAELAILNSFQPEINAARERDIGKVIVSDIAREGRRALGTIRAAAASSGVTENFSVIDTLATQAYENGRAASHAAAESAARESAYRIQAADFRKEAQFARMRGEDIAQSTLHDGRMQAATLRTRSTLMLARGLYGFGNTISSAGTVFEKLQKRDM
jgi:hypothetical protein